MTFREELLILLKARYPIIYIVTIEEDRLEHNIRKILSNKTPKKIYIWDFIDGYRKNPILEGFAKRNPLGALEFIELINSKTPSIFILKDFKIFLKDILISRKLRNLIQLLKIQPKTIILVDSQIQIPSDLRDNITVLLFPLPTSREIKEEIKRLTKKLELRGRLPPRVLEKIIQACQGLSLQRIRRVLGKSLAISKRIDQTSIALILEEKRQIINQTELLEFWSVKEKLKNIGGAYNLKKWLKNRADTFSEQALNYGLITPKGVLLIGMQGSGKSLIAKAVAYEWRLPLLRLDVGRLFGGLVGESESRVRQMIIIAESLAPCVLWVDEIDKAFSESEQNLDGGTTNRVLSTFITWLSEKTCPVFVIATANDIHCLPVEILRKGRFDEIFFLGIPDLRERHTIFEVHLKRFRPDTWYKFDIQKLGLNSHRFSGAEIEQTIIDAMYYAFSEKREFTTNDILLAINQTVPILDIDPMRTELIQSWTSSGRIRLA
uniref:Uncharacterized AAA domain-containing protein ycf46 n=1 Tax=Dictyopteris divaricata TaxID=156996 RepID=A0A2I4Q2W2_9PHAE|nr:hypothetical protein [Dictyopteris divaricata]YP_010205274.1 hypothetical protein LK366_pgp117 [Grateloupia livida]AQZ24985.1 hypothetical protein [Dictyopteris divaricata]UAV85843.1 hypothetical protein [Grateloupia livida]